MFSVENRKCYLFQLNNKTYFFNLLPNVSGAVPHHLLLLQRQPLNDTFAVIDKLAVECFLHRSHHTCSVQ